MQNDKKNFQECYFTSIKKYEKTKQYAKNV